MTKHKREQKLSFVLSNKGKVWHKIKEIIKKKWKK